MNSSRSLRGESGGPRPGTAEVHSITGAASSLTDDQSPRTRRYLVSMGIRTACVIGAIVVPGWPRWVLLAGAVILPYLAVVAANAGRSRGGGGPDLPGVVVPHAPALPAGSSTLPTGRDGRGSGRGPTEDLR